ncbi:hypothetical protein [Clostridium sporogenes]|uniref:hypothetical protein n=1 Tax=Clostridium sporogenes TaxID=1509 RepID=UPI002238BB0E|nr:hypothetical protein [Clostridium sporogenes]
MSNISKASSPQGFAIISGVCKQIVNTICFAKIIKSYPGYLLRYNPNRFDDNVKVIQNKLQNVCYSVGRHGVDVYFVDGTLLIVKCFQRHYNLMRAIGVNTWNRIMRD